MRFKVWLEIVDPAKPLSRVNRHNIVKDKGTNVAKPAVQFSWRTKLGNMVKLHFTSEGENSYEVVFYVNDTLYDDASANTENTRDPEILSGIFYLLKEKADKLGANELSFRAYESKNDTKTIRGLDSNEPKSQAITELQRLGMAIQQYQPQLVQPNQNKLDLWKKIGRGVPEPTPDFNTNTWMSLVSQLTNAIQSEQRIITYIDQLKTGIGTDKFRVLNYDFGSLLESLTNFDNAVASNSEQGWPRKRNRRAIIYSKIINRTMAGEWDIQTNGSSDRFTLTRKQNPMGEAYDAVGYRYVHNDGSGLMNNASLNYDKLDDDEYADVEDEYLGLQQPPSDLHNQRVVFVFTQEGEQRHQRLIQLLSKASKTGVRREEVPLDQHQIIWQSSDGQLALS